MSYCRFSEGDVYLIAHCYGGWVCYLCNLHPVKGYNVKLDTAGEVRDHLQAHIDAGHEVPGRAMAMITEEIAEMGEDYANPCDESFC